MDKDNEEYSRNHIWFGAMGGYVILFSAPDSARLFVVNIRLFNLCERKRIMKPLLQQVILLGMIVAAFCLLVSLPWLIYGISLLF